MDIYISNLMNYKLSYINRNTNTIALIAPNVGIGVAFSKLSDTLFRVMQDSFQKEQHFLDLTPAERDQPLSELKDEIPV